MAADVQIVKAVHEPFKYTPLPGEEEFFIQRWGGGDKAAYHAFCFELMHGPGVDPGVLP